MIIIFKHIIIYGLHSYEKFLERSFIEERHAKYAKNIESTTVKAKIMLYNGNQTICCDCRKYLDSDSILGNTAERFYVKMLFDPLKKIM